MYNSNFKVGDIVYFRHSVWLEWYQGKITRIEKEFEGCFKYIIHHTENEYYHRYSYDENVVKELPEGTYFDQMTFAPDTF